MLISVVTIIIFNILNHLASLLILFPARDLNFRKQSFTLKVVYMRKQKMGL